MGKEADDKKKKDEGIVSKIDSGTTSAKDDEHASSSGDDDKSSFSKEEVDKLVDESTRKVMEEFDKKLKDVASTEKNKLYETIQKEKNEKEALAKRLSSFEEAEKAKKVEEEQKRKEELDVKERLTELESKTTSDNKRFQELLDIKDKEFQARLKQRDLEVYREKKVAEAKGNVIPELVRGESVEEIDKAYNVAVTRYEEIRDGEKKKIEADLVKNGKIPGPDVQKDDSGGNTTTSSGKNWGDIHNMSPEEFEKHKDNVLKQFS